METYKAILPTRSHAYPAVGRTLRLVRAGAILAVMALVSIAVAQEKADQPIKGPDTPVVKYDDKTLTAGDLVELIKESGFRGSVRWDMLTQFGVERLDDYLKRYVSDQYFAQQAAEDGEWKRPESVGDQLKQLRDRLIMQQLYKTGVSDKVTTPTENELRAYYKDNQDNYRIPFSFTMRHLFLSTYEDYKVKKGDTLEIIAQNVTGDKDAASGILVKATRRPPTENDLLGHESEEEAKEDKKDEAKATESSSEEEEPIPPNAELRPGEELMVPMPSAKAEQVKQEIDGYYKQLEDGADFKELAAEHSQAASGGEEVTVSPTKEHPMLPKIIDAVKSTEVGSYSKPFRTKHGWQIVQVVKRTDESIRPFEGVKQAIQVQLEREQQKKLADEFIGKAFATSKLLKINPDSLKKDAPGDAVIAKAGDFEYTRQDLSVDFPEEHSKDLTLEQGRNLIKTITALQRIILLEEAEKMQLDQTPEVKRPLQQTETALVAQAYVQHLVDEKSRTIDQEQIKEYYEENKESFKEARKLDLYVIALPIDAQGKTGSEDANKARTEVTERLKALKEQIKDLDSFKKLAAENSTVKPEESGHVGEVTSRYMGGFSGTLESMKTGEVVGPVDAQNRVYLLWANSEAPAAVPPLEEIQEKVEASYKSKQQSAWEAEIRGEVLDKAGYKFLLSTDKTADTE